MKKLQLTRKIIEHQNSLLCISAYVLHLAHCQNRKWKRKCILGIIAKQLPSFVYQYSIYSYTTTCTLFFRWNVPPCIKVITIVVVLLRYRFVKYVINLATCRYKVYSRGKYSMPAAPVRRWGMVAAAAVL